jgi:phosphoribosylamine-glycine ligase
MGIYMRAKFLVFKGPEKHERLIERAKIVAKNFSNETYGVALMDYMIIEIYNQFKDSDDFHSEQICIKAHELRSWLEFFNVEIETDDNEADQKNDS